MPRVTLWEKLPATTPLNKTAAKVVSQRGDHYNPDVNYSGHWHADAPPRMRKIPARSKAAAKMIGHRTGRLKVVGLYAGKTSKWVVRCSCGDYELRTARALRNPHNKNDKCQNCHHLGRVKHRYFKQGSRPLEDFIKKDGPR